MFNNARNNNFFVAIPKTFFPDFIVERYQPFINAMTNINPNLQDFINHHIMKITIPNMNYEPVEQGAAYIEIETGAERIKFRDASNFNDLVDRNFTITMGATDGYLNYWIMFETFVYWYSFSNTTQHPLNLPVVIMDNSGNPLFKAEFQKCLFTGLSEFELDYTSPTDDLKTFDCSFTFNRFKMSFIRGNNYQFVQ